MSVCEYLIVVRLGPVHVGADPVVHYGLPDHAPHADGDPPPDQVLHIQGDEEGARPAPGTETFFRELLIFSSLPKGSS